MSETAIRGSLTGPPCWLCCRQGLDWVLDQARKYGIRLLLTLTNGDAGFGGMSQYSKWHGLNTVTDFYTSPKIRVLPQSNPPFPFNLPLPGMSCNSIQMYASEHTPPTPSSVLIQALLRFLPPSPLPHAGEGELSGLSEGRLSP